MQTVRDIRKQPDGSLMDCGDDATPYRCPSGYILCVSHNELRQRVTADMLDWTCRGLDERREAKGTGDHAKQGQTEETAISPVYAPYDPR